MQHPEYVFLKAILQPSIGGKSQPFIGELEDGRVWLIKHAHSELGPRILFNEMLGCKIAQAIGITCPEVEPVWISQEVIQMNSFPGITHRLQPGLACAVQYFKQAWTPTKKELASVQLSNPFDMGGIIAFDTWLRNADRHRDTNNMLLIKHPGRAFTYTLIAIDMGHCLGGPFWTVNSLAAMGCEMMVWGHHPALVSRIASFHEFERTLALIESFDVEVLQEIVGAIPYNWNESHRERTFLVKVLAARRSMVREILTAFWKERALRTTGRQYAKTTTSESLTAKSSGGKGEI